MDEKIIKAYNEIVQFNNSIGFVDSKKNIASQVLNKLDFETRYELMQTVNTEKFKTIQAKINLCVKYILDLI
ncbi:MAG: hypothetical protein J6D47_04085 [Peptostreptococcaceae bacterium]|nr:hypothetical protein [Peptostreptococcaceae bacterium]